MRRLPGYVLLACALSGNAFASPLSPWATGSADVTFNSNVTNAPFAQDIRSDSALDASITGGGSLLLDRDLTLDLSATADIAHFARFSGLDNIGVQAGALLRRKFGLGALAPYVSAGASVERREYHEDVRTGWGYDAWLAAGKRVSDGLRGDIEYRYRRYLTDHDRPVVPFVSGAPFDVANHSIRAQGEYAIDAAWSLVAAYTWRTGDVVATTRPSLGIFTSSAAIAADPAFGPDFFAYRLGGHSHLFDVSANYAIGAHTSVSVTYERWITHADADLNYFNSIVRATIARNF